MSEINDGGPAFPDPRRANHAGNPEGMSLREYYAGQALNGWLASWPNGTFVEASTVERVAQSCVVLADALLVALQKDQPHD
jgi:hypothetical protein